MHFTQSCVDPIDKYWTHLFVQHAGDEPQSSLRMFTVQIYLRVFEEDTSMQ